MNTENDTEMLKGQCAEAAFCSVFQAMFLPGAKKSGAGLEILYTENWHLAQN